jgi:hypothetical protein
MSDGFLHPDMLRLEAGADGVLFIPWCDNVGIHFHDPFGRQQVEVFAFFLNDRRFSERAGKFQRHLPTRFNELHRELFCQLLGNLAAIPPPPRIMILLKCVVSCLPGVTSLAPAQSSRSQRPDRPWG